jgi:hypothetical protein
MYEPIFNLECVECDSEPVVGIRDDEGSLRCTHLCGSCFFSDRSMNDWDLWNEPQESTE